MDENKQNKVYVLVAVISSLIAFGMLIKAATDPGKIVFVDIGKLLTNYQFRKDLEDRGNTEIFKIKHIVDSLQLNHKLQPSEESAAKLRYAERVLSDYSAEMQADVSKKVWDRLNPVLQQYGKEKHKQLMIGANGAGTVLYGSPENDITEDVIKYANDKYRKGN